MKAGRIDLYSSTYQRAWMVRLVPAVLRTTQKQGCVLENSLAYPRDIETEPQVPAEGMVAVEIGMLRGARATFLKIGH